MEIEIRESRESDITELKDRLREEDTKEVIADGHADAESALRYSFARSTLRLSVVLDGAVVAMLGLVPDSLLGQSANVWFLGADDLKRMKKTFVRFSRQAIENFLLRYPLLWNYVDARYTKTISWLKSCGALFSEQAFEKNGQEFYLFVIKRRA